MRYLLSLLILAVITLLVNGCANQLPPPGGPEDLEPPKIVYLYPPPNTVNFKGDYVEIEFNEYFDVRSFRDAFYVTPVPEGGTEITIKGKKVVIEFPAGLKSNTTYLFTIGRDLRDINKGNTLSKPIKFAVSTGPEIDKCSISGKVYADNLEKMIILLYKLNETNSDNIDASVLKPDYVTQVDINGSYIFQNIPEGKFRLFALKDTDRNSLFDKDFDKIAVLDRDIVLAKNDEISNANFLLKKLLVLPSDKDFVTYLTKDSSGYIYSSVRPSETNIPVDQKFYFFFNIDSVKRTDITDNIILSDSTKNKNYKLIFNWYNDSILEIFSLENFRYAAELKIVFNFLDISIKYFYILNFKSAPENKFGQLSGKIYYPESNIHPVPLYFINKSNKFIAYNKKLLKDTTFVFKEVLDGEYIMFSFIDENNNGIYDEGNYYPFKPAEKFFIPEYEIKLKGGWSVDNIIVNF